MEEAVKKLEFMRENPELSERVDVLDKGFVRMVDFFGDDSRIVDAARVSYQNGTKAVRSDAGLIDYLIRHEHMSPIEQVSVTFHIKLPLFVLGHIVRHRTGKLNASSFRYSEAPEDDFYIPSKMRKQSTTNKQGSVSSSTSAEDIWMRRIMEESTRISKGSYDVLREKGTARELARIILPQNQYTEIYWKQDLRNLLHLIKLRDDPTAQLETQEYARAMYSFVERIFPLTVRAWDLHIKNSVTLSSVEIGILRDIIAGARAEDAVSNNEVLSKGAKREALEKLRKIVGE